MKKFYNEKELADQLGVSVSTIRKWRILGIGVRYRKFGKAVRYSTEDLAAYLQTCPSGGGGQQASSHAI
jgi:DNA-binding transcriptional MerR regulator